MSMLHLRRGGVSVLIDAHSPSGVPTILHWGEDLGALDAVDLEGILAARSRVTGISLPPTRTEGVVSLHNAGSLGQPGLRGHRAGRDWSPLFVPATFDIDDPDSGDTRVRAVAIDDEAALELVTELELTAEGLLRVRAAVRNTHTVEAYLLERLSVGVPVPQDAAELLDFTGRHGLERVPIRQPFTVGARERESWRGRTGHDAAHLTVAGERGFGFQSGRVWATHVAWSGNHRSFAERLITGESRIGGGEALWPGEVILGPGEAYSTPWLFGSFGRGLDELSSRFHSWVRRRPHLSAGRARAVTVNSWEAVGFELDELSLLAAAERAAAVGAERFVVDDGWFGDRRDDTSSLGDWYPDRRRWPRGLARIADRVHELGMEFGLWFEPEMISLNSELARAHPEWVLRVGGREPLLSRNQLVLDLSIPEAFAVVRDRMCDLIAEYGIDFIKWDHNRDLVDAAHQHNGRPAAHDQTLAAYRLHDELRAQFPGLAIEGCSSGGARIDLEIVTRVDRFWTSDNLDPLERQRIQQWTQLLLPPELLGSHIASATSLTTGRTHSLDFRAATVVIGDPGIELDLTRCTDAEFARLREWIGFAIEHRELVSTGTVVNVDRTDAALLVRGVVSVDQRSALFSIAVLESVVAATPGPVTVPGLDSAVRYRVADVTPGEPFDAGIELPQWLRTGLVASGRTLGAIGVELPLLRPEQVRFLLVVAEG